jgi:hypothetical protein
MSTGELTGFTDGTSWRGLAVVTELRSAVDRSRVVTSGVVVASEASEAGQPCSPAHGFRCTLFDGTGRIDLLFLGRGEVPGLGPGARCRVEGTARMDHGRLTLWNPLYDLEPPRSGANGWPGRTRG